MSTTIARLQSWLRGHHPEAAAFSPGATEAEVDGLERALGVGLPDGMRALYRFTGARDAREAPSLMTNFFVLRITEVASTRAMMAGFVDDGTFGDADYWHKGWVPFMTNGAGSYLCWDPVGSFESVGGQPGQILEFWKRDADREILAPSFDAWLEVFVDSLEIDIWRCDDQYGVVDDDNLFAHFLAKRFPGYPKVGAPMRRGDDVDSEARLAAHLAAAHLAASKAKASAPPSHEVLELIRKRELFPALMAYRAATGAGLLEAKLLIDELAKEMGLG